VKNTGRCRELLVPGCRVYLAESDNPARRTRYDLIATEKERSDGLPLLINLDSQIPNDAAEEWLRRGTLFSPAAHIRREVTHGASRFNFYVEDGDVRAFLEVKGVTLEQDGIALFPDAPTERGIKHLRELADCLSEGYRAYVLFVIAMKGVRVFRPNEATHPAFGQALRQARDAGVELLAMDCNVTPDSIALDAPIAIEL
jgi:sugar fermentation stimulation protein A